MTMSAARCPRVCLVLALSALAACASPHSKPPAPELEVGEEAVDPAELPEREAIDYYIRKLPDRDYVETYGGDEHPRPWYSAAEAFGAIGKPAVPDLIGRLDTQDPYELKLVVYALMLASQDPALLAETNGEYLRLDTVLTEDTNSENRLRALAWWQHYRHLWD